MAETMEHVAMKDIVKVQVPFFSNDPEELVLVYSKNRKNLVQQPLSDAARKQMGEDLKAFFEAEFRNGRWLLGQRVTQRDW
jgi:hypothetical protein